MSDEEAIARLDEKSKSLKRQLKEMGELVDAGEKLVQRRPVMQMMIDQALATARETLEPEINDGVEQLRAVVSKVHQRIDDLGALFAHGTREASTACIEKLEAVKLTSDAAFQEVTDALAETSEEIIAARDSCVDAVSQTLDEYVATAVEETATQTTVRVEAFAATLSEKTQEVLVAATVETDKLLRRELHELATPVVDRIEEAIDDMFDRVRASVVANSKEAASKRETMEALAGQVEPAFKALQDALEHVRGVARRVGVPI
jgi:hypothetical protein